MVAMFRQNEVVIDDFNYQEHVETVIDGSTMRRGLIPRNYSTHPLGSYKNGAKFDLTLTPRVEWSSRIKDMVESESRLSDIRLNGDATQEVTKAIPSLDQGKSNYCWAHSGTSAVTLLRAVQGLAYVQLNAFAIACIIKNFQNTGGWGAQGLDFIVERGVPSSEFWKFQSWSRSNDNPKTWENAALHKVTEGFMDMEAAQYDRKLSFDQVMTCLLLRIPVITDFNWWSHSVCAIDPIEVDSSLALTDINRWGIRILNSWGDQWSDRGMGVLKGNKAVPDGSVAPRVTLATAA